MTTYNVEDKSTLVFAPAIDASGALGIVLLPAEVNYTVPLNEIVQDDILVSFGSVTLRVLDSANNTMDVSSDGGASLWTRPSGVSEKSVTIPTTSGATTTIDVLIMAKGVTGGVVAQRTQVVIIKHRPVGT
jgi:hypothetical protein